MKPEMLKTIADLVTRARLGDQVASGTLVVVGKQASNGNKRAQAVKDEVLKYIKAHPQESTEVAYFGVDTPPKHEIVGDACLLKRNLSSGRYTGAGLVILILTLGEYSLGVLTHGPSLLFTEGQPNGIVEDIRDALVDESMQAAFDLGNEVKDHSELTDLAASLSKEEQRAMQLGMLIGRARRLQAVKHPSVPLTILCERTAWELGE